MTNDHLRKMHVMTYAWEKFYDGTRILLHGDEPLPDRLRRAWLYELHHAKRDGIPEDQLERYDGLRAILEAEQERELGAEAPALVDDVLSILLALEKALAKRG